MEAAILRAQAYVAAGADAIFPEALTTEEDFRRFRQAVSAPLAREHDRVWEDALLHCETVCGLGLRDGDLSGNVAPSSSEGSTDCLSGNPSRTGHSRASLQTLQTRAELYDTIHYYEYESLDEQIAKTVLPEQGADD